MNECFVINMFLMLVFILIEKYVDAKKASLEQGQQ